MKLAQMLVWVIVLTIVVGRDADGYSLTYYTQSSQQKYAGNCFEVNSGSGSTSWADEGKATGAPDNQIAVTSENICCGDTELLVCNTFGFSVPPNSVMDGLVSSVRVWSQYANSVDFDGFTRIYFYNNGGSQGNGKDSGVDFPAGFHTVNFGSPSDDWSASLTTTDMNAAHFGMYIRLGDECSCSNDPYTNAGVDSLSVTLHYTVANVATLSSASAHALPATYAVVVGSSFTDVTTLACHFSPGGEVAAIIVSDTVLVCLVPASATPNTYVSLTIAAHSNTEYMDGSFDIFILADADAANAVLGMTPTAVPADVSSLNTLQPAFNIASLDGIVGSATWVALVDASDTCTGGPRIGAKQLGSYDIKFASEVPAVGSYHLCISANGNTGGSYVKVPPAVVTLTAYGAQATDVVAISPTTIGVATAVTIGVTYAPGRSFAGSIGFGSGGCGSPIGVTAVTGPGSAVTLTAGSIVGVGDYAVCYSVYPGVWVQQTGVSLAVRAPTISGIVPDTWGAGGTPLVVFSDAPFTSTGTRFGFKSGTCSGAVTGVPYTGAAVQVTQQLSTGTYLVCGSVNDGLSYTPTGYTVTVTPSSGELTGVVPATFVSGAPQALTFAGVTPTVTTVVTIVTSSSSCVSPVATFALTTSVSGHVVNLPPGTYYTCIAGGFGPVHQSTVGQIVVVDADNDGVVELEGPETVAPGSAVFVDLDVTVSLAAFPSAKVALAYPGGCAPGSGLLLQPTLVTSLGAGDTISFTTFNIPSAWPVSSPEVLLDVCFAYDGVSYVKQDTGSLRVLVSSPALITSFLPAAVVNGSAPAFQIFGPAITPSTFVAVAYPGTCATTGSHLLSGVPLTDAGRVVVFTPLTTPASKPTVALCVSIDGGSTYVDQLAASSIPVFNDPLALSISSIDPLVVVANAIPTITVGAPAALPGGAQLSFTNTSCASVRVGTSPVAIGSFALSSAIPTPGRHSACYTGTTPSPPVAWVQQIGIQTELFVLPDLASNVIGSILPASVGVGAPATVTVSRSASVVAVGCDTCSIGFDLASCTSPSVVVSMPTALDSLSITLPPTGLPGPGTYKVCFNTGAGWVEQTLPSITAVDAVPSAVSTASPAIFGNPHIPTMLLSTPFVSPFTRVALTSAGDCVSGFDAGPFVYDTAAKPWPLGVALAPGAYILCYSVDGGSSYAEATASVTVTSASGTSISAFSPVSIGARTTPAMTFTGAVPSAFTGVAFVPAAGAGLGTCANAGIRTGVTAVTTGGAVALGSQVDVVATSTFVLCYTVTLGTSVEQWFEQTLPSSPLTVVVASPFSLSNFAPLAVGLNALETVSVDGLTPTPTTRVAFTYSGTCETILYGNTLYTVDTGGSFALATGLPTIGSVRVCYSVDDGATWHLQDASLATAVVEAKADAVTAYSPTRAGAGTSPTFSIDGTVLVTPSAALGFGDASGAGCAGPVVGQIALTSWTSAASALTWSVPIPGPSDTYVVCYTVDGTNWVEQTSGGVPDFELQEATMTAITSLAPDTWGVGGANFEVALTGTALPTPTSYIGFTMGSCGGALEGLVHFDLDGDASSDSSFEVKSALSTVGTYNVCYSVTSASAGFVPITGVTITTVAASAGDVTNVAPASWSSYVLESLTLTYGGSYVATPTTRLGFVASSSGPCSAVLAADIVGVTILSASASVVLDSGLPGVGSFDVCFSVDGGATWIDATAGAVTTVGATGLSITGLSRTSVDAGVESEVQFYGANVGANTRVGLVNLGFSSSRMTVAQTSCNTPSLLLEETVLSASVGANLTLTADGNHAVCYSENGGVHYEAQVGPGTTLVVQECSQYTSCGACRTTPTCTWCLSSGGCVDAGSTCPVQSVCPTCTGEQTTCPVASAPPASPARGVYTGGSTLVLDVTYATDPPLPLECEFFIPATLRKTRVPATIVSTTRVECVAPPSELGLTDATVTLMTGTEAYTALGNAVPYTYYVCESVDVCGGCTTDERPECGYCMETQTCSAADQCAAGLTWGAGSCPTLSSVVPADGLVTGGAVLTLSGSYFVDVPDMGVVFGSSGVTANASYVSSESYTVVSPALATTGPIVLSLKRRGRDYVPASGGVVFNFLGDPALLPKPPPPPSPAIIGSAVAAVVIVLCVVAAILAIAWQRRKAREALLRPPVLTDEMREQIMFGPVPTLSAEDRKLVGLLQSFVDAVVMDHELIATIGDVTQATEMDKITRSVNMVYESRGLSLQMLLYMVSREVSLALSQSTLFRTNSFATKLFKTFSKMKGLDYLHLAIGRQVNLMLLEGVGDVDSLKNKGSNTTLERFALLERCQKVFASIKDTEPDVPKEFRFLFEHVRTRMQKKFPVSSDDLGLYIADSLRDHLDETSEAYIEGNNCFDELAGLAPHIQSDMAVLGSIIGPVQENLSNFEATIKSLSTQLHKVNSVVDQLRGALDPQSEQAQRFLEEHQRVQNSIAVGGFFFLRFLVPALTAPEAFRMVHELPTPDERKLLVMIGKVLQNLSNGKEFGSKEKFMTSMNIYILENQDAVARLFDTLSNVPEGTTAIASLPRTPVPKRHLEAAVVSLFKHARTNREKIIARLRDHSFGGKRLPPAIVSQREQAAKVFALVLDQTQQFIDAGAAGVNSDYLIAGTDVGGPPPRLQSMIGLTDDVFDSLMELDDYVAPADVDHLGDLGDDDDNGGGVALATLTLTPIAPRDSSDSSDASDSASSLADGSGELSGELVVPDTPALPAKPAPPLVNPNAIALDSDDDA